MKINRTAEPRSDRPLGPRPAARPADLSPARAAVLDRLVDQPEPVTIGALADATGLHGNTVREHLDALVESGLVAREQAPAKGRGRPAWLYSAVSDPRTSQSPEYAGLAAALASHIQRTSASPRDDALAAGTEWGRELARDTGPAGSNAAARREVVRLLDGLGFAPEPDSRTSVVKLTRCPLLEAAHRYPEVVCGVHLGIVRGALAEYGGEVERSELTAFAEPGWCRLELLAPDDRR
ncbi:MAG: helix-turn-helix transcriptional regulator [Nocardioidaceae bacterium]